MRRRKPADRRYRRRRLRRRLARAEGLQRRRHSREGRHARTPAGRASRRSGRHAQPLHRGRGRRTSSSLRSTCPTAIRSAPRSSTTSSSGWSGSKRMPASCSQTSGRWSSPATGTSFPKTATSFRSARRPNDALVQPETRVAVAQDPQSGLDRRAPRLPPRRGQALHLLGLYRGLLAARRGLPHRSFALLARSRRPAASAPASTNGRGRRRKASDHAPAWVELG